MCEILYLKKRATFNFNPCDRYCLLIGRQLTTWSQGNLHYIFQLDREFFCLSTQSCAALFCCRLAIRASSLGRLVGNYCFFRITDNVASVAGRCKFRYPTVNVIFFPVWQQKVLLLNLKLGHKTAYDVKIQVANSLTMVAESKLTEQFHDL